MIGAIIGDIAGSRFEFNNYRKKDFEMLSNKCFFTDDTIMTLAIAKAVMEYKKRDRMTDLSKLATKYMVEIGKHYPNSGYGGRFYNWIYGEPVPYNSFGNGAAMRVAACGLMADGIMEAIEMANEVTKVSHNHPEGIRGGCVVAACVYIAKHKHDKELIKTIVENNGYKLNFTIDEIRPTYQFNETCQDTVPQAIEAFLESTSFEDAIRIAVSVGGDSDTLAAITGSIASAYYGVPEYLEQQAVSFLDDRLLAIYKETTEYIKKR